MNILLINHYAGSLLHGLEYRPYYISREWIKMGHTVTIVASSVSHIRSINPDVELDFTVEDIDNIRYIWIKTPKYQGNGVKRAINMFSFVTKLFKYQKMISNISKPDVVIASSTYPLDIYPAFYIARSRKAKLIFEVHDLWPLSPIELGGMSPWHPFILIMQMAEKFAYRNSDKVVSMLPKADQYMISHGMNPLKFSYIPNGIVCEDWDNYTTIPDEHRELLDKIKESGRMIVGYAGTIGLANALEYFIESAKFIASLPVSLVLVGKGFEKEKLQKKVIELKLDNVHFLPPVPKKSIPDLLSKMDILYIGWRKSPLYRFGVSPNKLMDYMMAGKPIIHGIEAGNDLVSESGCGISIPPEDPQEIANAIMQFIDMTNDGRIEMGRKGKEYVIKHHDYKVLAQKFIDIMERD